jgi:hypothetical protein
VVEVKDLALHKEAADAEDTAEALPEIKEMILVDRTAAPPGTTRVRLKPILAGATLTMEAVAVGLAAVVVVATAAAGKCLLSVWRRRIACMNHEWFLTRVSHAPIIYFLL